MKKPRLHRWRLLLALLLGVGTWWAIGWWLSPRVYWERWYEEAEQSAKPQGPAATRAVTSFIRNNTNRHARILDRTERYLMIHESYMRNTEQCEIIDLPSRQRVALQQGPDTRGLSWYASYLGHVADSHGVLAILQNHHALSESMVQGEYLGCELWLGNLLTKESVLLKTYPRNTTLSICSDGSTMLEVERITPLAGMLFPNNLATFLSNQAEMHLAYSDLAVMRVWSLPELKLRCTITLPWMYRQNQAQLTCDGEHLVLPDVTLPSGFESTEKVHVQHRGGRAVSSGILLRGPAITSLALPKGIKVYNTRDGALHAERNNYEGGLIEILSTHPQAIVFRQEDIRQTSYDQGYMLHLPTKQWHEGCDAQVKGLEGQHVHWIDTAGGRLGKSWLDIPITGTTNRVMQLDSQGNTKHLADTDRYCKLLPAAHQYYTQSYKSNLDLLPSWLSKWLISHNLFGDWLSQSWSELKVTDYLKQRTLLDLHTRGRLDVDVTDHWMIVSRTEDATHHIAVYALPLPSWSSWWARGAGIMVVLVCLSTLRRRNSRGRGHAVLSVPPAG